MPASPFPLRRDLMDSNAHGDDQHDKDLLEATSPSEKPPAMVRASTDTIVSSPVSADALRERYNQSVLKHTVSDSVLTDIHKLEDEVRDENAAAGSTSLHRSRSAFSPASPAAAAAYAMSSASTDSGDLDIEQDVMVEATRRVASRSTVSHLVIPANVGNNHSAHGFSVSPHLPRSGIAARQRTHLISHSRSVQRSVSPEPPTSASSAAQHSGVKTKKHRKKTHNKRSSLTGLFLLSNVARASQFFKLLRKDRGLDKATQDETKSKAPHAERVPVEDDRPPPQYTQSATPTPSNMFAEKKEDRGSATVRGPPRGAVLRRSRSDTETHGAGGSTSIKAQGRLRRRFGRRRGLGTEVVAPTNTARFVKQLSARSPSNKRLVKREFEDVSHLVQRSEDAASARSLQKLFRHLYLVSADDLHHYHRSRQLESQMEQMHLAQRHRLKRRIKIKYHHQEEEEDNEVKSGGSGGYSTESPGSLEASPMTASASDGTLALPKLDLPFSFAQPRVSPRAPVNQSPVFSRPRSSSMSTPPRPRPRLLPVSTSTTTLGKSSSPVVSHSSRSPFHKGKTLPVADPTPLRLNPSITVSPPSPAAPDSVPTSSSGVASVAHSGITVSESPPSSQDKPQTKGQQRLSVSFASSSALEQELHTPVATASSTGEDIAGRCRKPSILRRTDDIRETWAEAAIRVFRRRQRRTKEYLEVLAQGTTLTALLDNGACETHFMLVSKDGEEIAWGKNPRRVRKEIEHKKSFFNFFRANVEFRLLAEMEEITYGDTNHLFARYLAQGMGRRWLCFSMKFPDKTFSFVCNNVNQVTDWFLGLQYLMPLRYDHITPGNFLWSRARMRFMDLVRHRRSKPKQVVNEIFRAARKAAIRDRARRISQQSAHGTADDTTSSSSSNTDAEALSTTSSNASSSGTHRRKPSLRPSVSDPLQLSMRVSNDYAPRSGTSSSSASSSSSSSAAMSPASSSATQASASSSSRGRASVSFALPASTSSPGNNDDNDDDGLTVDAISFAS